MLMKKLGSNRKNCQRQSLPRWNQMLLTRITWSSLRKKTWTARQTLMCTQEHDALPQLCSNGCSSYI